MSASARVRDRRLASSLFYWARLQLPRTCRVRGVRDRTRVLRNLLETHLPVPLEAVHATFVRVSPTAYVACVIEADRLRPLLSDELESLGPDTIPEPVRDRAHDSVQKAPAINVLHGGFTSRRARRRRTRLLVAAYLTCQTLLALATVGMERRVAHRRDAARSMWRAVESLAPADGAAQAAQPPVLRLTARLRSAELTARSATDVRLPPDASVDLASLLERWPPIEGASLDAVRIENGACTVSLSVPSPEVVPALLARVTSDGEWSLSQPTIASGAGRSRASVTFARTPVGERSTP